VKEQLLGVGVAVGEIILQLVRKNVKERLILENLQVTRMNQINIDLIDYENKIKHFIHFLVSL
jgi:hypothetical protein